MENLATTRMSSKGQVVIPEAIRKRLNLKDGAEFVVVGEGDVVILKAITAPSLELFEALIQASAPAGKCCRAEARRYCQGNCSGAVGRK